MEAKAIASVTLRRGKKRIGRRLWWVYREELSLSDESRIAVLLIHHRLILEINISSKLLGHFSMLLWRL